MYMGWGRVKNSDDHGFVHGKYDINGAVFDTGTPFYNFSTNDLSKILFFLAHLHDHQNSHRSPLSHLLYCIIQIKNAPITANPQLKLMLFASIHTQLN